MLFAGRAEVPAAAFFYHLRSEGRNPVGESERVLTFAPLVTNQEPNRPVRSSRKVDTWTIVVNGSEIREVDTADAAEGDALTWKLAMWGSYRDRRLLESLKERFKTLGEIAEGKGLRIHEGFQPRTRGKYIEEIVGKKRIKSNSLRGVDRLFAFSESVFEKFPADLAHARPGRDELPVVVFLGPRTSSAMPLGDLRFIATTSSWLARRQPAIAGPKGQSAFLKVLSLYLSTDFARYHQFLMSPQWGIFVNISNLDTLKALPVPNWDESALSEWLDLHLRLVQASGRELKKGTRSDRSRTAKEQHRFGFDTEDSPDPLAGLVKELNDRVYQLLAFREDKTTFGGGLHRV